VVQTTGFKDRAWLDEQSTPITSKGKLTGRFRRMNYLTLEIENTVDVPKTVTKPWSFKLDQSLMPDTKLIELVYLESNKSVEHLVGK
jgi:hypothetical protein